MLVPGTLGAGCPPLAQQAEGGRRLEGTERAEGGPSWGSHPDSVALGPWPPPPPAYLALRDECPLGQHPSVTLAYLILGIRDVSINKVGRFSQSRVAVYSRFPIRGFGCPKCEGCLEDCGLVLGGEELASAALRVGTVLDSRMAEAAGSPGPVGGRVLAVAFPLGAHRC